MESRGIFHFEQGGRTGPLCLFLSMYSPRAHPGPPSPMDSKILIIAVFSFTVEYNRIFVFLHEFGHHKASLITEDVWNRILAIYHRELTAYKAQTTSNELHMFDHIIENSDHYLNEKHGAIEEIFSDTNALLNLPNTARGLAERVLILQEMFPETMAEIAKYL